MYSVATTTHVNTVHRGATISPSIMSYRGAVVDRQRGKTWWRAAVAAMQKNEIAPQTRREWTFDIVRPPRGSCSAQPTASCSKSTPSGRSTFRENGDRYHVLVSYEVPLFDRGVHSSPLAYSTRCFHLAQPGRNKEGSSLTQPVRNLSHVPL